MMQQIVENDKLLGLIIECSDGFQDELLDLGQAKIFVDKIVNHAELILHHDACQNLIGCVAYYCNNYMTLDAYVTLVAVHPKSRGRGIARIMLQECLAVVGKRRFERVKLRVLQRNKSALALYCSMGFNIFERGDDDVGMYMVLKDSAEK